VFVQYIRNPSYFVVQYESDIPKIEQLNIEINLKYGHTLPRAVPERFHTQGEYVRHARAAAFHPVNNQNDMSLSEFMSCMSSAVQWQRHRLCGLSAAVDST